MVETTAPPHNHIPLFAMAQPSNQLDAVPAITQLSQYPLDENGQSLTNRNLAAKLDVEYKSSNDQSTSSLDVEDTQQSSNQDNLLGAKQTPLPSCGKSGDIPSDPTTSMAKTIAPRTMPAIIVMATTIKPTPPSTTMIANTTKMKEHHIVPSTRGATQSRETVNKFLVVEKNLGGGAHHTLGIGD